MLKRIFLLATLLVASSLLADAISIGRSRDGYPLIIPQVRKLTPAAGLFPPN